MVFNIHRNHKAYEGWGEGGMEVEEERGRLYIYRDTVTTRMTPALRWTKMRAILMFHCEGQSHKTVSTNHSPFEEKGELKRNRTKALLLTSLTPYR